jgi:hypothetical protein
MGQPVTARHKEDSMLRSILILLILLILGAQTQAWGHPPGEVQVEFDVKEHVLRVRAQHIVKDPSKHYVDRIVVGLNGEKVIEQKFRSQNDSAIQLVEYDIIDAKTGDEFEVMVRCNISGQRKARIVVEEQVEHQGKMPLEED